MEDSYHITGKGEAKLCPAKIKCRLGTPEEHYPTKEAARAAYEEAMDAVPELSYKHYNRDIRDELEEA